MKKALLFICFLLVLTATVGLITLTDESMHPFSDIELVGSENVKVEVFGDYVDEGCIAKEGNKILGFSPIEYETNGEVNLQKLGEYKIKYTTRGETTPVSVERIVEVVDTTAPVITAPSEITAFKGAKVFNFKYSAVDNYDGDITEAAVSVLEDDVVVLTVLDSSGNKGTANVKVNFVDDVTPPVITLEGFSHCHVKLGNTFEEPGYKAVDNRDGDVTASVKISSKVDTSKVGTYEVTYTVTDDSKNTASVKRKVTVYESPMASSQSGSIIYLTFDDGPGKYTDKLLNILDKYGVKATFFVTNQFSDYQYLIGKAHRQGHSIGVHTYSHQWSIYKNKDTFFADFASINEIIKRQTGEYSRIFRFPGGSNNVASRKYGGNNIMTLLKKEARKSGYVGFDWNVDCRDTEYKNSTKIYNQVKQQLKKNRPNIVLMHDIKSYTVNSVPKIIEYALANGYKFGVLDENTEEYYFG